MFSDSATKLLLLRGFLHSTCTLYCIEKLASQLLFLRIVTRVSIINCVFSIKKPEKDGLYGYKSKRSK